MVKIVHLQQHDLYRRRFRHPSFCIGFSTTVHLSRTMYNIMIRDQVHKMDFNFFVIENSIAKNVKGVTK